MRVLFVAAEATPYVKTGGLADVAGSLPRALGKLGLDVRVVLPRYSRAGRTAVADIPVGSWDRQVGVYPGGFGDEHTLLVGSPDLYERERLYGHSDDGERFIVFCRAALEAARLTGFRPDVIHCNDWQTGLIPVYLKTLLEDDPFFAGTASVFTVHNLGYQGRFGPEVMSLAGLPSSLYNMHALEFHGTVSFLKAGLVFADKVSTVSQHYAEEIQTEEYGAGLEGVLRERNGDLRGIVNGIDMDEWNPEADPHIPRAFSADHPEGKAVCKQHLESLCGLGRLGAPLFAAVTRIVREKGVALLAGAVDGLVAAGGNIVILGSGDPAYESLLRDAALRHRGRVAMLSLFDEPTAHQVYAGSDYLLMPSLYEPCGLSQMIAMRYGTVPVVRATGGLSDTVPDCDATPAGTGYVFDSADVESLLGCAQRALLSFHDAKVMRELRHRGMTRDFSWERSARRYVELYEAAGRERAGGLELGDARVLTG